MHPRPTKKEVISTLEALEDIPRPEGDNEGDSINSPDIYNALTPENQERVDQAEKITSEYLRNHQGEPNNRAIKELNKAGFRSFLQTDQCDSDKLVGRVRTEEWELDVSDPDVQGGDD